MARTRGVELDVDGRRTLLTLARECIQQTLVVGSQPPWMDRALPAALRETGASIVTVRLGRDLRGSAGSLELTRPLCEDVWHNTWAAAFDDRRFAPLTRTEWPAVHLHLSVLSHPERMLVWSEAALIKKLRPEHDGLILEYDGARAVFPPSAWSNIADPKDFVAYLKLKAGLPADFWNHDIRVARFSAVDVSEVER